MSVYSFIAHFLKENGYPDTLRAFEAEHGKRISTELPNDENLADIIADRMKYLSIDATPQELFDQILNSELSAVKAKQFKPWSAPYPEKATPIAAVHELVVDSAIMEQNGKQYALLATSARELVVVDLSTGAEVARVDNVIGKVVIRKVAVSSSMVLLCGMNGVLTVGKLSDKLQFNKLYEHQIHPRLVTDIQVVEKDGSEYLVSLGWDFTVRLFQLGSTELTEVGQPYKLANQGSCFHACVYKGRIVVLVGKNEITLMDVLSSDGHTGLELSYRIALNDAEFSAAGFTPMCIRTFCGPGEVPLVAVGTSHEPYMRVVMVTLQEFGTAEGVARGQIIANVNTMSPQDKFSLAHLEWRYDGSGLWVVGEDGAVRGFDLTKREVVLTLQAHEGRIKAASVARDVLLTCGTDRKVVKWT